MAIGVGLLGHGNVGKEVHRVIAERYGDLIEIKKILVVHPHAHPDIPQKTITTSFDDILADEAIKIVVELIGGDTPARNYIVEALKAGRHVVTANKAVISQYGHEIIPLARKYSVQVRFEAAVGGGVPLIRAIEQVRHGQIRLIAGILNGTCNFILTQMEKNEWTFDEALRKAKKDGYAEKNHQLDIDGTDTCHKISILATLAFGTLIKPDQVPYGGIQGNGWEIIPADLKYFSNEGFSVKLLGLARRYGAELEVRVAPFLVKNGHFLTLVDENYNGLWLDGDFKHQYLYGMGAGPGPTAVTVISGIYDLATSLKDNVPVWGVKDYGGAASLQIRDMNQVSTHGYIRSLSPDELGVFAAKHTVLSQQQISVQGSKYWRETVGATMDMPDYIEISPTSELRVENATKELSKLQKVTGSPVYFRIADDLEPPMRGVHE